VDINLIRSEGEDKRKAWAAELGLKRSRGHTCLTGLLGEHCNGHNCVGLPGIWVDHAMMWLRGGQPVLVTSEPYGANMEVVDDLIETCRRFDLKYAVSGESFYLPGITIMIYVWKDGVCEPNWLRRIEA